MERIVVLETRGDENARIFRLEGASPETVAARVDAFLRARGYRRESAEDGRAVYNRGSVLGQLVFGFLVPHRKFLVGLEEEKDGTLVLVLAKAMSGTAGGLYGVRGMTEELESLARGLRRALAE